MSKHQQSTLALKHLTGFGWIDPFLQWPAMFRLPTLLAVLLPVIFLPWLFGASLDRTILLLVQVTLTGLTLAVYVILALGAQADFESGGAREEMRLLEPSTDAARKEDVLGVLVGISLVTLFSGVFEGGWVEWLLIFQPSAYQSLDPGELLNIWGLCIGVFIYGVIVVHISAFAKRHVDAFCLWAENTEVDLLNMERYQIFTLQPMRYLLITVIFVSMNIVVYQLLKQTLSPTTIISVQLPYIAALIVFIYFIVRPMVIVRNRIKVAKTAEVDIIRRALAGDRERLKESRIAHLASEFSAPDLMLYEQRIQGIWEWPIQGNVQRIGLYILLPPLAWVLAAFVERIVDALL